MEGVSEEGSSNHTDSALLASVPLAASLLRSRKRPGELPKSSLLHVVLAYSNFGNFSSRRILAERFKQRMASFSSMCELYVVELAYGSQGFEMTSATNAHHLQLRLSWPPLWHKENLINLGVSRLLPPDWQYFAWIDADVEFESTRWVTSALHTLKYKADVVQLFSVVLDMDEAMHAANARKTLLHAEMAKKRPMPPLLSPEYYKWKKELGLHHSSTEGPLARYGSPKNKFFSFGYKVGKVASLEALSDEEWLHPGFAWAMNRKAYEQIGGLFDKAILGSADNILALSLVGKVHLALPPFLKGSAFEKAVVKFQGNCAGLKLGYVPGTIMHHFHGKKSDRGYASRWEIIRKNHFSPNFHLMYNKDGLLVNTELMTKFFLEDIAGYFRSRNEDSGFFVLPEEELPE